MVRILIVDDHPVVRSGIKQMLASYPGEVSTDEAGNGQEALSKVMNQKFDVILLDISMPGRNGLEILQDIKKRSPDLPVIILSMYSEDQYAVRALKAGASGYLTKDGESEELVIAIQKVLDGKVHFDASVVEQLIHGVKHGWDKQPHERLSTREYQVLRMIAKGQRLTEIADELSLSLSSVSTHRQRILKKMNMKSNADIVRYVIEKELLD